MRVQDLTPAGQRYFLRKTRPQMLFWGLVILGILGATAFRLYLALR